MVTSSERITLDDKVCQSTVAATSTISAIREMLCDVKLWRHRKLFEVNCVSELMQLFVQ